MSYDLFVRQAGSMEAGDDRPLGSREMIMKALEQVFPDLEWESPDFGVCEDGDGSAEFSMGDGDPVAYFAVTFHGLAIDLMERLERMARTEGWEVFDPQEGDAI